MTREEAIKGLKILAKDFSGYKPNEEMFDMAIKALEQEHPKGKWIKIDSYDRRDHFYACSECGRLINIICNAHLEDYPFCHCGADMRGEQDEYQRRTVQQGMQNTG